MEDNIPWTSNKSRHARFNCQCGFLQSVHHLASNSKSTNDSAWMGCHSVNHKYRVTDCLKRLSNLKALNDSCCIFILKNLILAQLKLNNHGQQARSKILKRRWQAQVHAAHWSCHPWAWVLVCTQWKVFPEAALKEFQLMAGTAWRENIMPA